MSKSDTLFDKIKATFGKVITQTPPRQNGDFLVKQNLAPMMGRRDAAYEIAYKLSSSDIVSCSQQQQAEICAALKMCLASAINDTEAILSILSSPDTVKRETHYLTLLSAIDRLVSVWTELILAREHWKNNIDKLAHFDEDSTLSSLRLDEDMLGDCEIAVVNRIKNIFETSQKGILRYRSYMTKSFSGNYLERYNKSFANYMEIYDKSK